MNINQQYISERNSYSGQIPRYIVIHNTDNYSTDADARACPCREYPASGWKMYYRIS